MTLLILVYFSIALLLILGCIFLKSKQKKIALFIAAIWIGTPILFVGFLTIFKSEIQQGKLLPQFGTILILVSPPDDLWVPIWKAKLRHDKKEYQFEMSHKYVGNHVVDLSFKKLRSMETAENNFEIDFVGVTSDNKIRPVGKVQRITVFGKKVNFLPVLYVKDENVRTMIPLSFKFTLSLFRYKKLIACENRILIYNRIEPALAFANVPSKKVSFIHYNTMNSLYSSYSEAKWRCFPWLYFQMEKFLLSRMDKIFVVNQKALEFYKDRYHLMADKFSFLPTWADQETFFPHETSFRPGYRSEFLKERNLAMNAKLILFVGRLESIKDPLLLIDSFNHANSSAPETILLIVGKGALRNKMEDRIIHHSLNKKVIFFNNLPQDKVADLMKISDVFLLTSASEGMPRSVLEALACGLPVVTTDVGEVKMVVTNDFSGLICPDRNAAVISDALLKVLNDNKFTSDNCVSSIQDYTAQRVLKRVYDTYRQLEQVQ